METQTQITEVVDAKGRPIRAYDLLRTYHFRDRRWGHQYMYHVAMPSKKGLEAVPVTEVASGKSDGGRFWLTQESIDREGCTIVHGGSPYPDNIFQERKPTARV